MAKITTVFLFLKTAHTFSESWNIADQHVVPLDKRHERIALARLPLLASDIEIAILKGEGLKKKRVHMIGTGESKSGGTREGLGIAIYYTQPVLPLNGVPKNLYNRHSDRRVTLTAAGTNALASYEKVLKECGAFLLVHSGKDRREVDDMYASCTRDPKLKEPMLRKLKAMFGDDEGRSLWEAAKSNRIKSQATVATK